MATDVEKYQITAPGITYCLWVAAFLMGTCSIVLALDGIDGHTNGALEIGAGLSGVLVSLLVGGVGSAIFRLERIALHTAALRALVEVPDDAEPPVLG